MASNKLESPKDIFDGQKKNKMFSQATIEKIGYYVYLLKDSRTNEVFYVGKGLGNRVFNHLEAALESPDSSDKLDRIREIISSSVKVEHYILRHGLSEKEAFEIEATLIDFIGMQNLTNAQKGHYSEDYGIKTSDEINAMYEAEKFITDLPALLININRLYSREMTDEQLYDATRKEWVLGERRKNVKYAIATYRGLTREVYEITSWYRIPNRDNRWGFEGHRASEDIRSDLCYKSIESYFLQGAANPIKYINC